MIVLYLFKTSILHFHMHISAVHFFLLVQPVWGSLVPTCGFMCSLGTPYEELEKPLSHHWASLILTTLPKQKIPLFISVRALSRPWTDFVSVILKDLVQSKRDQIKLNAPFLFLFYLFIFALPAACLQTITLLGPMFGFLLGSYCARLYVDIGYVDMGTVSFFQTL